MVVFSLLSKMTLVPPIGVRMKPKFEEGVSTQFRTSAVASTAIQVPAVSTFGALANAPTPGTVPWVTVLSAQVPLAALTLTCPAVLTLFRNK